jgi:hypothetical protein
MEGRRTLLNTGGLQKRKRGTSELKRFKREQREMKPFLSEHVEVTNIAERAAAERRKSDWRRSPTEDEQQPVQGVKCT